MSTTSPETTYEPPTLLLAILFSTLWGSWFREEAHYRTAMREVWWIVIWISIPEKKHEHLLRRECLGLTQHPDLQIELGTACGKLFRCSTMAILDQGDSDILSSNA